MKSKTYRDWTFSIGELQTIDFYLVTIPVRRPCVDTWSKIIRSRPKRCEHRQRPKSFSLVSFPSVNLYRETFGDRHEPNLRQNVEGRTLCGREKGGIYLLKRHWCCPTRSHLIETDGKRPVWRRWRISINRRRSLPLAANSSRFLRIPVREITHNLRRVHRERTDSTRRETIFPFAAEANENRHYHSDRS